MQRVIPYIRIARFDHWFKNVFMLPGTIVALTAAPDLLAPALVFNILLALLAAGLVASSNYVLNEILDAPRDSLHPLKKNRPIPSGKVNLTIAYCLWIVLGVLGIGIATYLGQNFVIAAAALWVMGCFYNIPPIRLKEHAFLDVLSESVNNPIRLLMGWYCTGTTDIPPLSLIVAYWMLGAFFMTVKRFAEYRRIDDPLVAEQYRGSFRFYNEEKLVVSITYYAVAFGLFFGIFLLRYRIELILSLPLLAGFFAWYIHIGLKEDSPTQYPEKLYQQRGFVIYCLLCCFVMIGLLFVDIPLIGKLFKPTISI